MSYCRAWNDKNQVYLYGDVCGMFVCCGCKLLGVGKDGYRGSIYMLTRSQAILHLKHHRLVDHKFPRRAAQRLRQELKEEGETFKPYRDGAPCIICGAPVGKRKKVRKEKARASEGKG